MAGIQRVGECSTHGYGYRDIEDTHTYRHHEDERVTKHSDDLEMLLLNHNNQGNTPSPSDSDIYQHQPSFWKATQRRALPYGYHRLLTTPYRIWSAYIYSKPKSKVPPRARTPPNNRPWTSPSLPFPLPFLTPVRIRIRPRLLAHIVLLILLCAPLLLLCVVLVYGGVPPDYSAVRGWERALPQHVWGLTGGVADVGSERLKQMRYARGGYAEESDIEGEQILRQLEEQRRYLRFPDHLWGHGLNNVLQEALLTAHLAHRARRSFVFEDFTWSHLPLPYTLYDFALRPTRVPLGAFVGGWIAGGGAGGGGDVDAEGANADAIADDIEHVNDDDEIAGSDLGWETRKRGVPGPVSRLRSGIGKNSAIRAARAAIQERRAVSAEYFEHVCPQSRRVELVYRFPDNEIDMSTGRKDTISRATCSASSALLGLAPPGDDASGTEIVEWWVRRLQQSDVRDARCVVVREEKRRVFDSNFFGSARILPLFSELKRSPVLRGFAWSPLVHGALQRTVDRFFSQNGTSLINTRVTSSKPMPTSAPTSLPTPDSAAPTIPGLLAVHLRRGDYKRHCLRLAEWHAGYMGFNRFQGMVDTFDVEGYLTNSSISIVGDAEVLDGLDRSLDPNADIDDEERRERDANAFEEQRAAYYLTHCLPTIPQIVARLHDVREEYQRTVSVAVSASSQDPSHQRHALRDVYVLTNGWPAFVHELREALLADGWARVVATPQLENPADMAGAGAGRGAGAVPAQDILRGRYNHQGVSNVIYGANGEAALTGVDHAGLLPSEGLTREEKGVSVAVDMGLAERAEVFVGNGFSSLSSNIVMLRMAKGMPVYSCRLL